MADKAGVEMVTHTRAVKISESEDRKSLILRSAYSLCWLMFLFFILLVSSASALEIKGTVAGMEGKRVKIAYRSEFAPQKGDDVRIGFKLGEDFLAVEGEWKIVKVTRNFVWAESKSADAGTPEPDYLAIIHSENPVKRSDLDTKDKKVEEETIKGARVDPEKNYQRGKALYEEKRYKDASKWFRKAVAQGHAEAQYQLGGMYTKGKGVAKDDQKAFQLIQAAAAQGHPGAQRAVGWCYQEGQGVAQDYDQALKWYRKAADQGEKWAPYRLGLMYSDGRGVSQNYKKAAEWYRKAAALGAASAQYNLGLYYELGRGVPKDYGEAVKWYRKAARQGNARAQNDLGSMCRKGWGIAQDDAEAVKWYRKAAKKGNAKGQANLGFMLLKGLGVSKDYKAALKWFQRAASNGNIVSLYNIGKMYENGWGVEKNEKSAKDYYQRAARKGHKNSQKLLKKRGLSW
ncbi:SEL1-like repeat protein [Thermodesulfobacteriota bacterium]